MSRIEAETGINVPDPTLAGFYVDGVTQL
jgi:hypothetical protein